MPKTKKPAPQFNPYDAAVEETEGTASLRDISEILLWTAPSPYLVLMLKERLREMLRRHGPYGPVPMTDVGIECEADLANIDGMSAESIRDMVDALA